VWLPSIHTHTHTHTHRHTHNACMRVLFAHRLEHRLLEMTRGLELAENEEEAGHSEVGLRGLKCMVAAVCNSGKEGRKSLSQRGET